MEEPFTKDKALAAEAVIRKVANSLQGIPFCSPVSLEKYPDYKDKVEKPMDLRTVHARVNATGKSLGLPSKRLFADDTPKPEPYSTVGEYHADVKRVFENCKTYDGAESDKGKRADNLLSEFEKYFKLWMEDAQPGEKPWRRIAKPTAYERAARTAAASTGKSPSKKKSNANDDADADADEDAADKDNEDNGDDNADVKKKTKAQKPKAGASSAKKAAATAKDTPAKSPAKKSKASTPAKASAKKAAASSTKKPKQTKKAASASKKKDPDSDNDDLDDDNDIDDIDDMDDDMDNIDDDDDDIDDDDDDDDEDDDEDENDEDDEDPIEDDDSEFSDSGRPGKSKSKTSSASGKKSKSASRKRDKADTDKDGKPARKRKKGPSRRPARDLKGVEIIFTTDAIEPDFSKDDEDFQPHFAKLQSILEWLDRVDSRSSLKGWSIEIIRRMQGVTAGSTDSYFLTPQFKRLRTRKDVANYLGLSADEECTREEAFKLSCKEFGVTRFTNTNDKRAAEKIAELAQLLPPDINIGAPVELKSPLKLNEYVTVLRLGQVVDHPRFVTRKHIYPVGYLSESRFFSSKRPLKMTTFRNEIIATEGKGAPIFRVTEVSTGLSKEGRSPMAAWTLIIVDILLGLHDYWERMAAGVAASERVCSLNALPSNASRALAKVEDDDQKLKIITKEVKQILQRLLKRVEANVERDLATEAARKRELPNAQVLMDVDALPAPPAADGSNVYTPGATDADKEASSEQMVKAEPVEGNAPAADTVAANGSDDAADAADEKSNGKTAEEQTSKNFSPARTKKGKEKTDSAESAVDDAEQASIVSAPNQEAVLSKKRRAAQLVDFIRLGRVLAGPDGPGITLEYKHKTWEASLREDGTIVCDGKYFDTPSAFSITMKRIVNPSKMADDGWKSCQYQGETLDKLKKALTSEDITKIEQLRSEQAEENTDDRRKNQDDEKGNNVDSLDALEDTVSNDLPGIGDKNYLAGAPNLHMLPQPHQIQWFQVDLTPLLNEQLGTYLFGIEDKRVVDTFEALPLMDTAQNYHFRLQRGDRDKEDKKLDKRLKMVGSRIKKALKRMEKHQDAVDRRVEAAARRHMRIEDRHARLMRVEIKRQEKLDVVRTRKEDKDARIKERQDHLDALKDLREEIKKNREDHKDEKEAEIVMLQKQVKFEEEAMDILQKELERAKAAAEGADELPKKEQISVRTDLKRAEDQFEKQQRKLAATRGRLEKLENAERERGLKTARAEQVKKELFGFYDQLEKAGLAIENVLDTQAEKELPDDLEVLEQSKPLAIEAMRKLQAGHVCGDLMEIWDFFSKYAPLFNLCKVPEVEEGLVRPGVDGEFYTTNDDDDEDDEDYAMGGHEDDLDINDDDDDDVDEDEIDEDDIEDEEDEDEEEDEEEDDDEEDEDEDEDDDEITSRRGSISNMSMGTKQSKSGKSSKSASAKKSAKKTKKNRKSTASGVSAVATANAMASKRDGRPRFKEGTGRTPIILLPEVRQALSQCDMHLLVPMHVGLAEMLFLGSQSTHESNMSEAARDRSISARRYAPLNDATWQELLRYYCILQIRQHELGRETQYFKEVLHHTQVSVSCVMSRAAREDEDDDENDDQEDDEVDEDGEPTGHSKRQARKMAKQRLVIMRELAMKPIIERIVSLQNAPYSGSAAAESLTSYPNKSEMSEAISSAIQAAAKASAAPGAGARSGDGSSVLGPSSMGGVRRIAPIARPKAKVGKSKSSKSKLKSSSALVPPLISNLNGEKLAALPEWAQSLVAVRDMPTNRGARIRSHINEIYSTIPETQVKLRAVLQRSISSGVFKSNAAGPCKRMILEALLTALRSMDNFTFGPTDDAQEMDLDVEEKADATAAEEEVVPEEEVSAPPPATTSSRKRKGGRNSSGGAGGGAATPGPQKKILKLGPNPVSEEAANVRATADARRRCQAVVRHIGNEEQASVFWEEVDTNEYPDYSKIVDKPMALHTVDDLLQKANHYEDCSQVLDDIEQIWINCKLYNLRGSYIYKLAHALTAKTRTLFRAWVLKEDSMRAMNPYPYDKGLPPAPWLVAAEETAEGDQEGHAEEEKEDGHENADGADSANGKKRKRRKRKHVRATVEDYVIPTQLQKQGFKNEGKHVDTRVARRVNSDDPDALVRGTVVACNEAKSKWRIKFDDDGDSVNMNSREVEVAQQLYDQYAAKKREKKAKRKERRRDKKAKRLGTGAEDDGDDDDDDDEDDDEDEDEGRAAPVKANGNSKPRNVKPNAVEDQDDEEDEIQNRSSSTSRAQTTVPTRGVPKMSAPPADSSLLLSFSEADAPQSHLGSIILKFFEDVGCKEGSVVSYDSKTKRFEVIFAHMEDHVEFVTLGELQDLERDSALLVVDSDRNGIEDERRELERLDSQSLEEQRRYRKSAMEDEDGKPTDAAIDACAPKLWTTGSEVALLRRFVVALGTQSYEDIDFDLRTQMLRVFCDFASDTALLREEVDRRMWISIRTRQKWRLSPPVIEAAPKHEAEDEEDDGVLDRLAGEGVAEQKRMGRKLTEFKKKHEGSLSKSLLRAIERVERDIERQKSKKKQKDDAKRWKAELEWKLQTVAIRPRFLGLDRYFNRYMYFAGDYSKLFVMLGEEAVERKVASPDEVGWRVIAGRRLMNKFLDSLNGKGKREAALLSAIQSRCKLLTRGEEWDKKFEALEDLAGAKTKKERAKKLEVCKDMADTLVGAHLREVSDDGNAEPTPARFGNAGFAAIVIGKAMCDRHMKAAIESSPLSLKENSSFEDKCLLDVKVVLLNMELAIHLHKIEDNSIWMNDMRKGWIRLVTSAANWRDLRQATCYLECAMLDTAVPLENWYYNLYGDAGFALRTKTASSLAVRVTALDSAILFPELSRRANRISALKRSARNRAKKKKKN